MILILILIEYRLVKQKEGELHGVFFDGTQ